MVLLGLSKGLGFRVLVLLLVCFVQGFGFFVSLSLLESGLRFLHVCQSRRKGSVSLLRFGRHLSFLLDGKSLCRSDRSMLGLGDAQSFFVIALLCFRLSQTGGKFRRIAPQRADFLPVTGLPNGNLARPVTGNDPGTVMAEASFHNDVRKPA